MRAPDIEGWVAIRDSKSPELFEQFLKEYPNSQYAGAARLRLAALRGSQPSNPPLPPLPALAGQPAGLARRQDVQPVITLKVAPEYTDAARAAHLQGSVLVSVELDESGTPHSPRVVRGLGFGLDQRALDAVSKWRFRPGTRDGLPAGFLMLANVDFRLSEISPWRIEGLRVARKYEAGSRGREVQPQLQSYANPKAAVCDAQGGYVVLDLEISNRGIPTEVKALASPGAGLGDAAIAAARSWVFSPALLNEKPKPSAGRVVLACEGPGFSVAEADRLDRELPGKVAPPGLIYKTEPEYSEEARRQKVQGVAGLNIQIDQIGRATAFAITKSLGYGLDEKAAEAIAQWRFKPASSGGKPVPTHAAVEVNFRLL